MSQHPAPYTPPRKGTTPAIEDKLDASLEDSFPASDPPSMTRAPAGKSATKHPPPNGADRKTPAKPDAKNAKPGM